LKLLWIILSIVITVGFLVYKVSGNNEISSETEELIFSPHALQRIQERNIPEDLVKNIINDRNSVVNYRFGNRFSLTKGEITVVLSRQFDKLVVVTVYWNRKKRKQ